MAAIVFDFDGVLADSMPLHAKAFRQVLRPFGLDVTPKQVYELEGMPSRDVLRRLLQEAGKQGDVEALARAKQAAFESQRAPSLFPQADALLGATDAPVIVTGTRPENVQRVMGHRMTRVAHLLADGDYDNPKPAPDPYLAAARRLGIHPQDLVAVENAPLGIKSALTAGYGTVHAVASTLPVARLQAVHPACIVHADHDHLLAAITGAGVAGSKA